MRHTKRVCIQLLLLAITLCVSCDGLFDNPSPSDRANTNQESIVGYNFSALDISGPDNNLAVLLREGDKFVFRYYKSDKQANEQIIVMFEVPRSASSFSISKFEDRRSVYATFDKNGVLKYNYINKGSISGRKISDNEWDVSINITGNDNLPLNLNFSDLVILR